MAELNYALRRQLIDLLERGEDVPLDYKHLLFPPERREYELVYAGKEREEDIIAETMAVPLQPIRTFGGNQSEDWRNMLIFGDNLQAMKSLLKDPRVAGQVKCIYIDPPFATKREFRDGQEERAYRDKITGAAFVEFLRKRLILLRELLHPTGAIFVHLDQKKDHYIKVILDEVFGEHNFRNEVIWRNTNTHSKTRTFGQIHQNIFMYSRSNELTFNKLKRPRFKKYEEQHYRHADARGVHRFSDLTGEGIRAGESGEPWLGYNPTARGRHWAIPRFVYDLVDDDISGLSLLEKLDYLLENDLIVPPEQTGGQPQVRRYKGDGDGIFLQDIWAFQPYTRGIYADTNEGIDEDVKWTLSQPERTGYPTQKPEGLLRRIIASCTNEGDIVLDAFAGSGTALAVAEKLGRRWIGIECGKLAVYTIQKRMLNLRSDIGNKGTPLGAKPFTLLNAGLYDFSQLRSLSWEEWRFFALNLFECQDDPHKIRGVTLDGYRFGSDVLVFNHRAGGGAALDYGFIDDLHSQLGSAAGDRVFILAPAASVLFLEDYVDKDDTRYYVLRIPYSIINELHNRDFEAIIQPMDELQVNDTVEAVGFDFIRQPKVHCEYLLREDPRRLFKQAVVQIDTFESKAMMRGASMRPNRETLSMVMVDYDYPYDPQRSGAEPTPPFVIDAVFYATAIEKAGWEVQMPFEMLGQHVMLIYVDVFGNEYTEIKRPENFTPEPCSENDKLEAEVRTRA